MTRSEVIRYLVLRSIGNFLILFAIFGVVATFGPALYFESMYRIAQWRGVTYTVADPAQVKNTTSPLGALMQKEGTAPKLATSGFGALLGAKDQIIVPKDTQFSILIPKINANATIVPNVDPGNEQEFTDALQLGVAHAKGTVFPGHKGNTYLFAHSTDNWWNVGRYNAIFYLLKDVEIGDEVIVYFENVRYNYVVTDSRIVDPTDVSYLVDSQTAPDETLIMQTCWPPGTTWKRLLVFAKPVRDVAPQVPSGINANEVKL
ncbi:MAG: sortase [Candidatus Levybacteria bacterium]|nr:sortase [Candidatus Levybacteria bacterium]